MPLTHLLILIASAILLGGLTVAAAVHFGGMSTIPILSIVALIATFVVVRLR